MRRQLELWKPELLLAEHAIEFDHRRVRQRAAAAAGRGRRRRAAPGRAVLDQARAYNEARAFGRLVSAAGQRQPGEAGASWW